MDCVYPSFHARIGADVNGKRALFIGGWEAIQICGLCTIKDGNNIIIGFNQDKKFDEE